MVIVCHWVSLFQNLNFIVLEQGILNAQYCVLTVEFLLQNNGISVKKFIIELAGPHVSYYINRVRKVVKFPAIAYQISIIV